MNEKLKGIYPIAIFLFALWFLSSCEKNHNKNECINVIETFQEYNHDYGYYYNKCENILDNEEEIEMCVDEMKFTTNEIKDYCDIHIDLNYYHDEY